MSKSHFSAAYRLTGFACHPDDITNYIGVEPSKTWLAGDGVGNIKTWRNANGWQLASRLPKTADFEDHLNDVLLRMEPIASAVGEIAPDGDALINVAVYIDEGDVPALPVAKAMVRIAERLNAGFDFDLYVWTDDQEGAL